MHEDNPYAAPQTIDTREVLPSMPLSPENRDYRWLKRGLGSLAMVLSPLTFVVLARFGEFAVLGLTLILPICCGMLAAVPPRTPGRICLTLAAIAQAVGCFCLFVLVLMPMHDQEEYKNRFENLTIVATVAELVCYASIMLGLIRLGHWLQDRWFCQLCYSSLGCSGLLGVFLLLIYRLTTSWDRIGFSLVAMTLFGGIGYLTFWATLILGLRIPRMITAKIPDPPRFE